MPAPAWTVSRPVRVWLLHLPGEWLVLRPGVRLTALDWQGANRVARHGGTWVVIPPRSVDALVLVPPDNRRSA